MNVQENNSGEFVSFTPSECEDFAVVCGLMPSDQLTRRELEFIRRMEVRFRDVPGGRLSIPQFNWFAQISERYQRYVCSQTEHVALARQLARSN